jgi:hypothetical protein
VRDGHAAKNTIWTEGAEDQPAGESFDHAADVMRARCQARHADQVAKRIAWINRHK